MKKLILVICVFMFLVSGCSMINKSVSGNQKSTLAQKLENSTSESTPSPRKTKEQTTGSLDTVSFDPYDVQGLLMQTSDIDEICQALDLSFDEDSIDSGDFGNFFTREVEPILPNTLEMSLLATYIKGELGKVAYVSYQHLVDAEKFNAEQIADYYYKILENFAKTTTYPQDGQIYLRGEDIGRSFDKDFMIRILEENSLGNRENIWFKTIFGHTVNNNARRQELTLLQDSDGETWLFFGWCVQTNEPVDF